MKHLRLTSWLLLAAMAVLFSGAASFVHTHEHAHHAQAAAVGHEHCNHGGSDTPDQPAPSDHDDCATCFVLLHLSASTLDLLPSAEPLQPVCREALLAPEVIFALGATRVPPGRGPPQTNQL